MVYKYISKQLEYNSLSKLYIFDKWSVQQDSQEI